jgi:hypothetical protein
MFIDNKRPPLLAVIGDGFNRFIMTIKPLIGKYEKTSNQLEDQIITMYAKGMSTRDIENHMRDIYGIDTSFNLTLAEILSL